MKRIIAFVALFCFLALALPVKADIDDEVDIVVFELVEEPQAPLPKFIPEVKVYEWDSKVVDELASIFWAETGRDRFAETEKKMITQLIFNRARYGEPFPSDIYDVMKQKGEFNHGKVSDKNRIAAKDYLNICQSQKDGYFQGIDLPTSAIYMGRNSGGELQFYDENWDTVYVISRGF